MFFLLLFVVVHQGINAIPRCIIVDTDAENATVVARSQPLNRSMETCSSQMLIQLEKQTMVPFEFRRLRLEQADQHRKIVLDEHVEDLSTAVYERRSDPEGQRYCRTCREGRSSVHSFSEKKVSSRQMESTGGLSDCSVRC
jgi:hypothetical protein